MNQGQEGRAFQNPDARGRSVSVLVVLSLIVVIAIFLGSSSVTTIEAGTRGVLKTFGEITGVLEEGLHFRMPFITSVTILRYAPSAMSRTRAPLRATCRQSRRRW